MPFCGHRRWGGAVAGLLILAGSASIRAEKNPPRDAVAEKAEAELAAPVLAEEQIVLREQMEKLKSQVAELTVRLAEVQFRADQLEVERAKLSGLDGSLGKAGEAATLEVAEVSRDLAMLIVEGGVADGLKAGLKLAVLRGDEAIARVRVVAVREKISGARIEKVFGDGYPRPGDRLIVWRSSME